MVVLEEGVVIEVLLDLRRHVPDEAIEACQSHIEQAGAAGEAP
jgi:hypothetical protein